jgi:hypothetical protein
VSAERLTPPGAGADVDLDHLPRARFMEVDDETPLPGVILPDSRSLSKLD